ncbi:hypothetical protein ABE599_03105 [Achromobacter mucicolens]|uniref:hypothetical protein n=1 Tax=Achromobacter mucicolens TaxID=1389922 RepID=UPI003207C480
MGELAARHDVLKQGFVVSLGALAFLAFQQIERGAQVEAGFDMQILISGLDGICALNFLGKDLLAEGNWRCGLI